MEKGVSWEFLTTLRTSMCGSHISCCSSSTYFDMHQHKAQVHTYGCNQLQAILQTDLAQFTVLKGLSQILLLSRPDIAST